MILPLEYVAGIFDGEGWVRVQTPGWRLDGTKPKSANKRTNPSFQIIAGMAMTHKPIILQFADQFGGIVYGDDHYRRKDPKNRTIYRWHVSSKKAEAFLMQITPHLIVKKEQAELTLALQRHIDEFRVEMMSRSVSEDRRREINDYRKSLAAQISDLKKVNFNLPIDCGAKPIRLS